MPEAAEQKSTFCERLQEGAAAVKVQEQVCCPACLCLYTTAWPNRLTTDPHDGQCQKSLVLPGSWHRQSSHDSRRCFHTRGADLSTNLSTLSIPDRRGAWKYIGVMTMQLPIQDGMKGGHLVAKGRGLSKPKAARRFMQEQDHTEVQADNTAATSEVRISCIILCTCLSCLQNLQ